MGKYLDEEIKKSGAFYFNKWSNSNYVFKILNKN